MLSQQVCLCTWKAIEQGGNKPKMYVDTSISPVSKVVSVWIREAEKSAHIWKCENQKIDFEVIEAYS